MIILMKKIQIYTVLDLVNGVYVDTAWHLAAEFTFLIKPHKATHERDFQNCSETASVAHPSDGLYSCSTLLTGYLWECSPYPLAACPCPLTINSSTTILRKVPLLGSGLTLPSQNPLMWKSILLIRQHTKG